MRLEQANREVSITANTHDANYLSLPSIYVVPLVARRPSLLETLIGDVGHFLFPEARNAVVDDLLI